MRGTTVYNVLYAASFQHLQTIITNKNEVTNNMEVTDSSGLSTIHNN